MKKNPNWSASRTLLAASVCVCMASCQRETPAAGYVPGLGEIMTLTQMRHSKLWLAGEARNWPLAAYEVEELGEGFADVVAYHPTHKSSPVSLAQVTHPMTAGPLGELQAAIDDADFKAFALAFDSLTAACNSCHQAAEFGFNVVQRPSGNPFPNQDFALPSEPPK